MTNAGKDDRNDTDNLWKLREREWAEWRRQQVRQNVWVRVAITVLVLGSLTGVWLMLGAP